MPEEYNYILITSCCNSNIQITTEAELVSLPPILSGVFHGTGLYQYNGSDTEIFKNGECYFFEVLLEEPGSITPIDITDFVYLGNTNCEDEDNECAPCPELNSYLLENCFDSDLSFIIKPENELELNSVISLDINPGNELVITNKNLCIEIFQIVHPDINDGEPATFSVTAVIQNYQYNNKPVYLITLDESIHGVIGLEITFYVLYSNSTWEVWDELLNFTIPINTSCDVQSPHLILTTGGLNPQGCILPTTNPCVYENVFNESSECSYYLTSFRNVTYCEEEIIINNFINCWLVKEEVESSESDVAYQVTNSYDTCEACTTPLNVPPCIKLINCLTEDELIVTSTEFLLSQVGKIIQVNINGTILCYKVELSENCPNLPIGIPGEIIGCFSDCDECLPACICTRALNENDIPVRLTYIDCNGVLRETEIINPKEWSKKYCVWRWINVSEEAVRVYGECIDQVCPEVPRPKKIVYPGYNTPICTPEKYEKIVCTYSENLYKSFIEKRFGIENCCPQETFQNELLYELIHLQMLYDPNYECTEIKKPCNC
jgi:hypothetical protein